MQPAQHDAAVVVTVEGGNVVRVAINGRPVPTPYAGEGCHSTAWAVFGDVVRRTIVGVTPAVAGARMTGLIDAVHTHGEQARLAGDRLAWFDAAALRCRTAIGQMPAVGALDRAVAAYLSACNYAPLASVWIGPNQAPGGGEARPLSGLRATETGVVQDAGDIQRWIWGLLDPRALKFVGGTGAVANAPGTALGHRPDAVTRMVLRHFRLINTAYPVAYHSSGLEDAGPVDAYLATLNDGQEPDIVWPTNWGALPQTNGMPALAPLNWSVPAGGPVVAIGMGNNGRISTVQPSGRGPTLLGAQGHHLTAEVVFEVQLGRVLLDRTPANARIALRELTDTVRTLPALPEVIGGRPTISAVDDPPEIFATAWDRFIEAEATLDAAQGDPAIVRGLSRLSAAYLSVRNALPLVSAGLGATANPANEGQHRLFLDTAEAGGQASREALLNSLWAMLNLGSIACSTRRIVGQGRNATTPGAVADERTRLAHIMQTHLISVQLAWPGCVEAAEFDTQQSLRVALTAADCNPTHRDLFAGLAGFGKLGDDHRPLRRVGGIKPEDEEEKLNLTAKQKEEIRRLPRRDHPTRGTRKVVNYEEYEEAEEPESPRRDRDRDRDDSDDSP